MTPDVIYDHSSAPGGGPPDLSWGTQSRLYRLRDAVEHGYPTAMPRRHVGAMANA
jgi:hypothetical protein